MNKTIEKVLLSASLFGFGLVGGTTTMTHIAHIPIESTAHANNRTNVYWTNHINKYAPSRAKYYYPEVTYNTRDLGGLKTSNGKYMIRSGKLYRSANLHNIGKRNAKAIKRLHIRQVIDLRQKYGPNASIHTKPQPGEMGFMKDKYGLKLHYHHYPVETSSQEAKTWPIRKKYGEHIRFGYWYTTNPSARRAYHNSITYMSKPHKGAILFNCTQGRDRTGLLSMITEYLLGISKRDIYNEFLLTNYYRYQSSYTSQIMRINKFYRTVKANYGNMWRYCRRGLYLPKSTINRLRHKYLKRI